MFSNKKHCILQSHQLAEVICQLHFPETLMIGAELPLAFQEASRTDFPQFSVRKDTTQIAGVPGSFTPENHSAAINYQFFLLIGCGA